jgi:PAS domain S-box-containing protein
MSGENKKTILLVEDEAILSMTGKMTLEKLGYKVVTMDTGENAVTLFKNGALFDLILMDIDLGNGIDGTEAAEIILQNHDIPILFHSSHTEPDIVKKTEKITSYGYVVKDSGSTVLDASIKMAFKLFDANQKNIKSEAKEKAMISNISDVIGIIGVDGIMKYKSPNIEKLFGWKPEDFVGKEGWITIHPDDLERVQQKITTLLRKENSTITIEYRYKCKNGSYKPVELTATNLINDPIINGILINYHDITERKQAEEALRKSNNDLRHHSQLIESIIENFPGFILWKDANSKFLGRNTNFAKKCGFSSPTEIIGKSDYELPFQKHEVEGFLIDDHIIMETKLPKLNFEEREHVAHGEEIFLNTSKIPLFNTEGQCSGILAVAMDITERKHAEEYLKMLKHSMDIFTDAIYWMDSNNKFVYVNEAGGKAFGCKPEELIGKSPYSINPVLTPELLEDLWVKLRANGTFTTETIHRRLDGTEYFVEVRSIYLLYNGKEYINGFVRDITERKHAEEALRQSEEKYRLLTENIKDVI